MKKTISLIILALVPLLLLAINTRQIPDDRKQCSLNVLDGDERPSILWNFTAKKRVWLQPTSTTGKDYQVLITLLNPTDKPPKTVATALAWTYQLAIEGHIEGYSQVVEYYTIGNSPIEWSFNLETLRDLDPSKVLFIFAYTSDKLS